TLCPEPLFEALILAGVVLLLWKRPLTFPVLAIGGALLGLSATVRAIGVALVVPAVVFALVAGRGGWQRILRAAVIGAAFVAVIGAYCSYAWIKSCDFELSRGDAYLLYGPAATIRGCRGLDLPHYQRGLCPNDALHAPVAP